ncbi:MAG: hypothetical protein MZV63_17980 [Marinilabiliales bacterium]|nr:hypothetical protein [Marinilabiliales bacterium]
MERRYSFGGEGGSQLSLPWSLRRRNAFAMPVLTEPSAAEALCQQDLQASLPEAKSYRPSAPA